MENNVLSALAKIPLDNKRQFCVFDEPRFSIAADNISDVIPCLEEIEQICNLGSWAFGYVSYESIPAFDDALRAKNTTKGLPLLCFGIFDSPSPIKNSRAYKASQKSSISNWQANIKKQKYIENVHYVHNQIKQGNSYQTNYTYQLQSELIKDPKDIFLELSYIQPTEFNTLISTTTHDIICASPELFFSYESGKVICKPMKGTIQRGQNPNQDSVLSNLLFLSHKDRAENTMIVDVVRNDLSRIAKKTTLKVSNLFRVETYKTLHQMTSTITCQTDYNIIDVFKNLFPAASITGAPKYQATKIISHIEEIPRGVYTGAIGFISPNSCAEFSVPIRTIVSDKKTKTMSYGVGSGITIDSDPEKEWQETITKTKILTNDICI